MREYFIASNPANTTNQHIHTMHIYNYKSEFFIVTTEYKKGESEPVIWAWAIESYEDTFASLESAKEFRDERMANPNVKRISIMELISSCGPRMGTSTYE